MKVTTFLALMLASVLSTNLSAFSIGEECHACNVAAENAMVVDVTAGLRSEMTYFVIDRGHNELRKFRIFYTPGGTPLSAEQSKRISKIDADDHLSQQRSAFNLPDHTIIEVQPSTSELSVLADYKTMLSDVFAVTGPLPPTLNGQTDIDLPHGAIPGINSGFGVETNRDDLEVGLWIQDNDTLTSLIFFTLDKITNTFGYLPLNYEYEVFVTLPDGSYGLWKINELDQLDLVEGTLKDSDHNKIPRRRAEVHENGVFFFSGGASSNNAARQAASGPCG